MVAIKNMEIPKSCAECKFCIRQKTNDYGSYGQCVTANCETVNTLILSPACPLAEIITCKDCKYCEEVHYEDEGEPPYIKLKCNSTRNTRFYRVEEDFYCGDGKRRE